MRMRHERECWRNAPEASRQLPDRFGPQGRVHEQAVEQHHDRARTPGVEVLERGCGQFEPVRPLLPTSPHPQMLYGRTYIVKSTAPDWSQAWMVDDCEASAHGAPWQPRLPPRLRSTG